MSKPTVKNRLADAFANLGLGDSRKKLDALYKPRRPSPVPKKKKDSIVKSTIVKPTMVNKAIVKKTIPKITIVKSTIVKKTMADKAIVKPAIVNKTIVDKSMVKPTMVKKSIPSPAPLPKAQAPVKIARPAAAPKPAIVNKTIVESPMVKPSFFWNVDCMWDLVDNLFPYLSPNVIVLFMYLLRESCGRHRGETGFISMNTLSRRSGITRKSVPAAMQNLISRGQVAIIETSGKLGNRYRVHGVTSKPTDEKE